MHDRRILGQQELRRSDARVMGSWFQPILASNKSVSILSKSRPEQLIENTEERVVRMTYRDADAVEDRRQNLERKLYDHFSFRPQIDPLSKSLGRYTGIDELSENPRGKALLERAQRDRERQQNKECSFQPRINKLSRQLLLDDNDEVFQRTYLNDFTPQTWAEGENAFQATEQRQEQGLAHQRPVSPRINMSEPDKMARDIRTHLAMKEERRRAELVLEEIRQLEGCTFWPSVVPFKPPSISKPVVVRGLGRHLELKHLSVRQKADRGLRENEVFKVRNVDKFRRADDGTTVVQVSINPRLRHFFSYLIIYSSPSKCTILRHDLEFVDETAVSLPWYDLSLSMELIKRATTVRSVVVFALFKLSLGPYDTQ
jgi:hypothetical protein